MGVRHMLYVVFVGKSMASLHKRLGWSVERLGMQQVGCCQKQMCSSLDWECAQHCFQLDGVVDVVVAESTRLVLSEDTRELSP